MNTGSVDWLNCGRGHTPQLSWSFATDAPLVSVKLSRESGDTWLADAAGNLYLLDRNGDVVSKSRDRVKARALACSDTGEVAAALVGEHTLCWFNRELVLLGQTNLASHARSLAMEAYGQYVAVSSDDCSTCIYDIHRRRLREFITPQPLVALEFLVSGPTIIGVAEYGMLYSHNFDGEPQWQEKLWGNVGDMATTGNASMILLASFIHGIQCHNSAGGHLGSFQLSGTVNRVSCSYQSRSIAASTLERDFFWLRSDGLVEWQSATPDDVCALRCDPTGTAVICGFRSGDVLRLSWAAGL